MSENLDLSELFWFIALLLFTIFLTAKFIKWRTKYLLGLLIIFITMTVTTAFGLIAPGKILSIELAILKFISGGHITNKAGFIILLVFDLLFLLFTIAFTFYPDIKKFLRHNRRRVK